MAGKKRRESVWYAITHPRKLGSVEYLRLINRVRIFVAAGLLISIFVFLVLAWLGGINKVVDTILSSDFYLYGAAFLVVFLGFALRFVKWSYYLKQFKLKVPLHRSILVYFSLYAMDITPGQIGRMIAAYALSKISDSEIVDVLPVVTMDIFTDSLGFAVLTLLAALYFNQYLLLVIAADLLLVLPTFIFLINGWFFHRTKNFMERHTIFKVFSLYGDEYFAAQSKLSRPKVYAVSLLVTIPSAFLWASALYFTFAAVGVNVPLTQSVFVFSTSQLFGMVSAIPGNLGVTDGALVALSQSYLHVAVATSYAVAIMARLATLWFGILFGSVFLFYTMKYWKIKDKGGGVGGRFKSAARRLRRLR